MTNNLPMELPKCEVDDATMLYQKPVTKEQVYVGAMYKCPCCMRSTLIPSTAIENDLKIPLHKRFRA